MLATILVVLALKFAADVCAAYWQHMRNERVERDLETLEDWRQRDIRESLELSARVARLENAQLPTPKLKAAEGVKPGVKPRSGNWSKQRDEIERMAAEPVPVQ